MTREKFKIQSGQPLVVTLETADGQQVKSNFTEDGVEYRYQVSRNGKPGWVYLPSTARNLLIRTRCGAGEDVEILKTGQNGHTQWRINPVSDAAEPAGPVAVPQTKAVARQQAAVEAPQIPTSHPIQERMTRMFIASAASLREAHRQIAADPFFSKLEPPNWEDIRSTAIHWAISMERKESGR